MELQMSDEIIGDGEESWLPESSRFLFCESIRMNLDYSFIRPHAA
jgi:hypothetical protein